MPIDSVETNFSEDLKALLQFKDYFKEKEKIAILVNWLNEELGLEKGVAALAVKYIAPFILAKIAKAAENVSQSWLSKLQDKLSEYSWFSGITSKLLYVLKTRTDRSYEKAIQSPSDANLKSLRESSQWNNLKSNQQGLLQLLIGQQENKDFQTTLLEKLEKFSNFLSFQLDLKSVESIQSNAMSAELGSALWLTYARQQVDLVGRDKELNLLNEFYHQDLPFSWWSIVGAGGLGKSRLALDSIASVEHYWDVGFLSFDKLDAIDSLGEWRPTLPTIIVIDYAAERAQRISSWLDCFIHHQYQYDFPVRLLILERAFQGLSWWEKLTSGSKDGLTRRNHLFRGHPLELLPLSKTDQQRALANFLNSLQASNKLPKPDNLIWDTIHNLTQQGSPLYLGMVAIAMSKGNVGDVRKWQDKELLSEILNHEKQAWFRLLNALSQSRIRQIIDMLALTTMVGGLDYIKDEDLFYQGCLECNLGDNEQEIEENWQWVQKLVEDKSGQLKPDLIAEYFLIHHWPVTESGPSRQAKRRIEFAFKLDEQNTLAFIGRCAVDFHHNDTTQNWVVTLLQACPPETIQYISMTILDIVRILNFLGKAGIALHVWLPLLDLNADPLIKGEQLNQQGKLSIQLGKLEEALDYLNQSLTIRQTIDDRAGQGAALNNISQIYSARRDYDSALNYLYQSLEINQSINDRFGESATLNNISLIHDARGEHDTALGYLHRSLTIQGEIGDRESEAVILNNISQNHSARGEKEEAKDYLLKSLKISVEIGHRAHEATALNNLAIIYGEKGDDEIALDYLTQSFTIRKEIGYKTDACVTLFNMANILGKQKKISEAMDCLLLSYKWAEELQYTRHLEVLKNLAPKIGLKDGLLGWQKLYEESEKTKEEKI